MPPAKPTVRLPEPNLASRLSLEAALNRRRSSRDFAPSPLRLAELGQLLWAAQGVTADDGGRTAPSAGALYPLEIGLVAGAVESLPAGLYRYHPERHALAQIAAEDRRAALAAAALDQEWMAAAPALIAIAAVYERTTGKYGQRGRSYVHMEVGHVVENIYLQATGLGLGTCLVGAFEDRQVRKILALAPGEVPLGLMPVGRAR